MAQRSRTCLVLTLILTGAQVALAATVPVAVSPGRADAIVPIESRCPAFSWGAATGAEVYELVVYRVGQEAEPVLTRRIPGSALSWTPALSDCLERGGQYAWSVRAMGQEQTSAWSSPSLFQIAPGLSELELREAIVRVERFLQDKEPQGQGPWSEQPRSTHLTRSEALAGGEQQATAATSGRQGIVAFADSCCDGSDPTSYASWLGNNSSGTDPDVLALELDVDTLPQANMNYIGFFDRLVNGDPRLLGEIEGDGLGGVHFTGSASISGWTRVEGELNECATATECSGTATCPAGSKVLGGGYNFLSWGPEGARFVANAPGNNDDEWVVAFKNLSPTTAISWRVRAICAEVGY